MRHRRAASALGAALAVVVLADGLLLIRHAESRDARPLPAPVVQMKAKPGAAVPS